MSEHSPFDDDDFGGLIRDLPRLIGRRDALRWAGGLGAAGLLAACSSDPAASTSDADTVTTTDAPNSTAASPATTATSAAASAGTSAGSDEVVARGGEEIPEETAGPFPADGSNGPNVLDMEGIVRTDITTSIGDLTGTADGVPLQLQLTVVDASTGRARSGAAIYLWHCTADGRYSIYEIEDQNFLRGVEAADDAGRITFTSVFPGCYQGRWPHCHFEVYESLDEANAGSEAIRTSQLALPEADCDAVYADDRYGESAANLSRLSLESDGIFRDGWSDQLATASGSVADGYTVSLLVRV